MKKTLAMILCMMLLISTIVGCSKNEDAMGGNGVSQEASTQDDGSQTTDGILSTDATPPTDQNEQTDSATESPDVENNVETVPSEATTVDFEAAYAAYQPDTLMVRAGGYNVMWDELFLQLFGSVNAILYSYAGMLPNWTDRLSDGRTYAQAVMDFAVDYAIMFKALEYGAEINSVTLGEDDYVVLQNDMQNAIDSVGSEEDFLRVLWEENGCRTLELYKYLCDTSYLANATFNKLYGENGELMSDEDLADYTSMDGFLMAKHILCLKQDDDEGAAKAEAESILASLNSYNGNDFDSFFDELMLEYSDDSGGLQSYPDGYLFQPGDMVPSFTEACAALDIGSYSGLVESDYGYHIIYRLPIDYDAIPFANYMQNDYSPLRYLTATSLFNSQILLWRDMLAPEYTSEYDSIEIADLFAWQ